MTVIEFEELSSLVNLHLQRAEAQNLQDLVVLFFTLKNTGLRGEEIYNCKNWVDLKNGLIWIPPHKKGNPKTIPYNKIHPLIRERIGTQTPYFFKISIRMARNYVTQRGKSYIYVGNKALNLHVFRYYFIRNEKRNGRTEQEIAEMIGTIQPKIITNYLRNIIVRHT